MNFVFKITFFISIILFSQGCYTNVDKEATLPEETQDGKNTLGFFVNSTLWLPKKAYSFPGTPNEVEATYNQLPDGKTLSIFAYRPQSGIVIKVLLPHIGLNRPYLIKGIPSSGTNFYTDSQNYDPIVDSSTIYITKFDTLNNIVSGRFDFLLIENRSRDTIRISKGVYDIKLNN